MLFKKEFDIDKDFFTEKPKPHKKRKLALRVFVLVMVITFLVLCYSAFTFNFNSKFGTVLKKENNGGLKEAQEYYREAVNYFDEGEYKKALELLNKQLLIVSDPDAYNYLGKIYMETGETELAIENFKKALEIKPDMFDANFELGKYYYSINDYKTASKYLTEASSEQIDNTEVLSMTAETYKKTGLADDAIVLLEKVLEIEPNSAFANAKIGEIYFQRLQYKEAIPYLEDSISYNFEENVALQLAKSYLETGDFDSAIEVADKILAENKENRQAQSIKKAIEYKKGLLKIQKTNKETPPPVSKGETSVNPDVLNRYIKDIELSIKTNWTPPVGSNLKKASVKFTINKEGELISNVIYTTSGMPEFDKSALDAIEMSKPYPPLPNEMNRETLDIIFTFDFNIQN